MEGKCGISERVFAGGEDFQPAICRPSSRGSALAQLRGARNHCPPDCEGASCLSRVDFRIDTASEEVIACFAKKYMNDFDCRAVKWIPGFMSGQSWIRLRRLEWDTELRYKGVTIEGVQ